MSGHSKWSTIKRKKGEIDAKRGKIFTKVVREITTAARIGGSDIDANPRLRAAVSVAKAARMPSENIDRAIKKGSGELDGSAIEEQNYEGYGPGGVALYVEAQTDNKNRTTSEVRNVIAKANGNLGTAGSVAWMFKKQGHFTFDAAKYTEEEVMDAALEGGATDVVTEGDEIIAICELKQFAAVANHFDKLELKYQGELTMVPENTVKVAGEDAARVLRLIEKLEEGKE